MAHFTWIIFFSVVVFNLFRSFILIIIVIIIIAFRFTLYSQFVCTLHFWLYFVSLVCSFVTVAQPHYVADILLRIRMLCFYDDGNSVGMSRWIVNKWLQLTFKDPLHINVFSAKFIWHVKMGNYYNLTINRCVSTLLHSHIHLSWIGCLFPLFSVFLQLLIVFIWFEWRTLVAAVALRFFSYSWWLINTAWIFASIQIPLFNGYWLCTVFYFLHLKNENSGLDIITMCIFWIWHFQNSLAEM